jgi:quinate dehydrogenase
MGSLLESQEPKSTYIVGINVLHTIAPPMHDHVAQKFLHLPWTFTPQECPTVDTAMTLFRQPEFAGGIVTMPYKKSIMPRLDRLDDLCKIIGACNCVYLDNDETGKKILRGTNTDWRGIKGCLSSADPASTGSGKPALIIGAGGASRAAVYALFVDLNCSPIYVINRDDGEVTDLLSDVRNMTSPTAQRSPDIIHIKSREQAMRLASPYYIVGTIPDFEPTTSDEIKAREILTAFLEKAEAKGVFLDMCYKPRVTRQIKLATSTGWLTVEGTGIIGHQIHEQYRLWAGADLSEVEQESARKVLREKAESSPGINF